MIKSKFVCLLILLAVSLTVNSQDSLYARKVIEKLASKKFSGRGYINHGDKLAAEYIANEFNEIGLIPSLENSTSTNPYFQEFSFLVNTFPSAIDIKINKRKLIPGRDFIVGADCKSIKGTFEVVTINKDNFNKNAINFDNNFILIDTIGCAPTITKEDVADFIKNNINAAGFIFVEEKKLTWSVAQKANQPQIRILRSTISTIGKLNSIQLHIESALKLHQTQNVIGSIKGTSLSDTMLVVTAHYDHLGKMGKKTYFPGANDNASGISMLLNLAKYYSTRAKNPHYSMMFICFAGEEAGLLGSEYYTEHPIFELSKIKFLLNIDLLGTGDEGMMVVNGSVFENEWNKLDSINSALNLLPNIGKRGKAHNSDHYYFTEKGVPSFFCYTLGGRTAYHDIYDVAEGLPLTKYKETFILLKTFLDSFK
jgi:aminopeptidase YwaD